MLADSLLFHFLVEAAYLILMQPSMTNFELSHRRGAYFFSCCLLFHILFSKIERFIERSARRNEIGELSSARINFSVSSYGVIGPDDQRALEQRATDLGVSYHHREHQDLADMRRSIASHVIGNQFGT